ncbi:cytochrome P450 [Streptomyces albus subsp. chlorinus]|uniref:cytochrome P450 n=1 Tax=Streptomyces albus TaxID=1888 RepID=UPI001571244E|nr:cytochrome P450 [Streptomyces albus]NSC22283.1 cytochrome P450 [Streptomyces albus subsp. chlorinus]
MPPPLSRPGHEVTALYGEEFAADPYAVYERLRRYGAPAPVETAPGVGAMLVLDHRAAPDLLHDPGTWSKDSRGWQDTVPADSPVMPLLRHRFTPLSTDGEEHARYRKVITDSFARLEPRRVREPVRDVSDGLLTRFAQRGRADLVGAYARPLPPALPRPRLRPRPGRGRVARAKGHAVFDSRQGVAEAADSAYTHAVGQLYALKKSAPGQDLASWSIDHPERLTPDEAIDQIALTFGAGCEPLAHLIGNALSRMLVDDRYHSDLSGGALTARDALRDVLRDEPPMANFSAHFPRRDVHFHGRRRGAGGPEDRAGPPPPPPG